MTSALFGSVFAPGGGTTPPKISEIAGRMTMKFLPDLKLNEEVGNQKKMSYLDWSVN